MKFCIDCKWHAISDVESLKNQFEYDKCSAPKSFIEQNLVRSTPIQKYNGFCKQQRSDDNLCGLAAAWFEPKEEQDVPQ